MNLRKFDRPPLPVLGEGDSVHMIGVSGTGMGALAKLLVDQGFVVSGSDEAFYPPMGPALLRYGVRVVEGYARENLGEPKLVVIGNACRPDHIEARAAIERGLPVCSFPEAIEHYVLPNRHSFVLAGTHGKTTTTALLSFLLRHVGANPGYLIGGVPLDGGEASRLGGPAAPFVIEGDEYDSAFFEKRPKFLRYRPFGLAITSVEHDHVDIYPDEASYLRAFEELVDSMPEDGILAGYSGDPRVRALMKRARCRVRPYALVDDDFGDMPPVWSASVGPRGELELYGGGSLLSRTGWNLSGRHNARNLLAALCLAAEGAEIPLGALLDALPHFSGVKRRQELRAIVDGVRIVEDFAHHPTAVAETLRGLRQRFSSGRIVVAFEPRSATASRRLHQSEYARAFQRADVVFIAPVGRKEIVEQARLDTEAIAAELRSSGRAATAFDSMDALRETLLEEVRDGDTLVLMSNGAFGGLPASLGPMLLRRALEAR